MTRISTICAVSGALAVLTLSANGASAATLVPATPKVTVNPVQPKHLYDKPVGDRSLGSATGGGGSGKDTGTTSGTKQ